MEQQKLARINALARKKKQEGLTPEEQAEQTCLRQEYLAEIRKDLESQLEHITVVNPDGTSYQPRKKRSADS